MRRREQQQQLRGQLDHIFGFEGPAVNPVEPPQPPQRPRRQPVRGRARAVEQLHPLEVLRDNRPPAQCTRSKTREDTEL